MRASFPIPIEWPGKSQSLLGLLNFLYSIAVTEKGHWRLRKKPQKMKKLVHKL